MISAVFFPVATVGVFSLTYWLAAVFFGMGLISAVLISIGTSLIPGCISVFFFHASFIFIARATDKNILSDEGLRQWAYPFFQGKLKTLDGPILARAAIDAEREAAEAADRERQELIQLSQRNTERTREVMSRVPFKSETLSGINFGVSENSVFVVMHAGDATGGLQYVEFSRGELHSVKIYSQLVSKGSTTIQGTTSSPTAFPRAIVGQAINGSMGAALGAATAETETTFQVSSTSDVYCHTIELVFNANDPARKRSFSSVYRDFEKEQVYSWYQTLNKIVERNMNL